MFAKRCRIGKNSNTKSSWQPCWPIELVICRGKVATSAVRSLVLVTTPGKSEDICSNRTIMKFHWRKFQACEAIPFEYSSITECQDHNESTKTWLFLLWTSNTIKIHVFPVLLVMFSSGSKKRARRTDAHAREHPNLQDLSGVDVPLESWVRC